MDRGKLRPFWRAVLYFAIASRLILPVVDKLVPPFLKALNIPDALSAPAVAVWEFELLLVAILVIGIFAHFEKKKITDYGTPLSQAFRLRFWEGFGLGLVQVGVCAAGMILLGGMNVHGLALSGSTVISAALSWLGACAVIGIAEQLWYRSYFLQTLWKSLGFWPGAILSSLVFTADHYFYKTGENVWDAISIFSFGLMDCYIVKRTGNLWFAIGGHIAFDFMQLFVIGTPNGSLTPVNHLLNVTFSGPDWLTGGPLGTEASWLMYPIIALSFLYITIRFRNIPVVSPKD